MNDLTYVVNLVTYVCAIFVVVRLVLKALPTSKMEADKGSVTTEVNVETAESEQCVAEDVDLEAGTEWKDVENEDADYVEIVQDEEIEAEEGADDKLDAEEENKDVDDNKDINDDDKEDDSMVIVDELDNEGKICSYHI